LESTMNAVEQRPSGPVPATAWWWGTNRAGGVYYAGRAHVVHPNRRTVALCGLPVEDVWELRPPMPNHLCPECCLLAMSVSHPTFPAAVDTEWFTPASLVPPAPVRAAQKPVADERVAR
jgi:hypothetical protein